MYLPTTPQALLLLKDARDNHSAETPGGQLSAESHPREGFLQEVKGFKSLNIELSWR
ncbi:hypothetical protein PHLGIDRAFT_437231 [Phlebiopsis gigantea 11061_1 CR5-6]|uniref:Uncharacterized protein n=1 Tax=Phlebiopsis gigantea (strain 11061_1 CR5-6) TaxID=745531 RepID=A0A0C3P1J0_PHLG1|nr:hypothetical protein PHLGIDRAFT_437231 [Phlebiopsis gigantea 11061_1 CR5-6]